MWIIVFFIICVDYHTDFLHIKLFVPLSELSKSFPNTDFRRKPIISL